MAISIRNEVIAITNVLITVSHFILGYFIFSVFRYKIINGFKRLSALKVVEATKSKQLLW